MTSRRNPSQLREDALAIWHAALQAVDSHRLVTRSVRQTGRDLHLVDTTIALDDIDQICVVGAGKAGAGMAAGLEEALGAELLAEKRVSGWINVPADCVRTLQRIHLHAARPAGINEPTEEGMLGCRQILDRVAALGPHDLCLCLLSGGGSALMPAPARGITLEQKLAVTRHLSGAGANIEQLNTVRKQLSRIKGGGLARACRAGRLITLIISDVLGDPLDVIASGPTVPNSTTAQDAQQVLQQFPLPDPELADPLLQHLAARQQACDSEAPPVAEAINYVIGNNAVAVDAAGIEAERRGYSHSMIAAQRLEGEAEAVGRHLARMALHMRDNPGPDCLISGGEPTVTLVDAARRGRGGRNQQLVLAALKEAIERSPQSAGRYPLEGIVLLSGGTDGEDGPTDAAGAVADDQLARLAGHEKLDLDDFLHRNDAYRFFDRLDGLITTGPTHTNVCDVRVVVVDRVANRG